MNKPAFPRPISHDETPSSQHQGDRTEWTQAQSGMSMLEFYAGQALIGFLTASSEALLNPDKAAGWAFEQAEAMVKEAEKRNIP